MECVSCLGCDFGVRSEENVKMESGSWYRERVTKAMRKTRRGGVGAEISMRESVMTGRKKKLRVRGWRKSV